MSCKPGDDLPFKAILPHLRHSLTGQRSGPDIFAVMALLGSKATRLRIGNALHAYLSKLKKKSPFPSLKSK